MMKKKGVILLVVMFVLFCMSFLEANTNVTECGVLDVENEIYELNTSISSSYNCLNINATNITLDCQGYNITFGNATGGKGIFVFDGDEGGYNNITIQNCLVVQNVSGADHTAIYFGGSSENGVVYNNTIIVFGYDTPGMLFENNSVNVNISSNNITTSGELGVGIVLDENASEADISNNIITTSGEDASGIKMADSSSGLVYNNTITTSGNWSLTGAMGGIWLESSTFNINVSTNTITMSGYGNAGMWIWSCSNHSIENNVITILGRSLSGMFLSDLQGVNITSNIINITGNFADGIYSYISENPLLFYNNVITTSGEYNYGLNLIEDSNNNISSNNITTSGVYSYGIFSNQSHNATLANNIITTGDSTSYVLYLVTSSNDVFYNNIFNTSTTDSGVYIEDSDLNYFNTTESTATNIIGEAYIGGNFWTNNAGTGYSDNCLDADNDYFCDSSYAVVEGEEHTDYLPLTNRNNMVSTCRTLDFVGRTYYLNQSIIGINETCFNITANNITFDFRGYNITGNTTGYGTNMSNNHTTIRNGFIYNFSIGIYLESSQNNNITNITTNENELNGLYVNASSGNLFINMNINNSGQDSIILEGATSDNNNFTDVSVINPNSSYYDINFSTAGIDGTWIIGINFANYSFAGAGGKVNFEEPSFGKIEFLEAINGSGNSLSTEVDIESNSVFVNSSNNIGLNKSANITLYSISYTDPKPQYSSSGSTYTDCTSTTNPVCTELSYNSTTDIYVFNVSHFTYFKTAEGYTAPESSSSSSSSGGTSTTFWKATYAISEEQFKQGYTKELTAKSRIRIAINNSYHYVGIIELTDTTAKINVSSNPQQATFLIGDLRKFDVTENNYYDLAITLNSIFDSKANITIKGISEEVTSETIDQENEKEAAATGEEEEELKESEETKSMVWIWIIIIFIVLILIGFGYKKVKGKDFNFWNTKKNKRS
ncbi:MAG: NosD domain-containing protein [archaeon]